MTHWNYRAVAVEVAGELLYEVHEVYYDDDGKPVARTAEAPGFSGETLLDLVWSLQQALDAVQSKPPMEDADFGVGSAP